MNRGFAFFALLVSLTAGAWAGTTAAQPPAATPTPRADTEEHVHDEADLARKAEIMHSSRWRRAIFELGEWLSSTPIYTPQQVTRIKADFNQRVAGMSSYELEYLLDDLDTKFKIIDAPEAREAREWVGQYLSVMSDRKRAEVLRDVPNIVKMNAAQLQEELRRIEQKRASLQQTQAAFEQGRAQLVQQAELSRQRTAQASAAAMQRAGAGVAYSPYRSQGNGKPPFSDVKGSGMSVGAGPFGAYVSFNVGAF